MNFQYENCAQRGKDRLIKSLQYKNGDAHGDGRDRGIDGGPLAHLHLVHRLLENGAPRVGAGDHVHLDDRLRIFSTLVGRLDRDAELLAGVQLPHRLYHARPRLDFEFMQPVIRHVVNAVRYLGVLPLVVVRSLDLNRKTRVNNFELRRNQFIPFPFFLLFQKFVRVPSHEHFFLFLECSKGETVN